MVKEPKNEGYFYVRKFNNNYNNIIIVSGKYYYFNID